MNFARRLTVAVTLALALPALGGATALVSAGVAHAAVASSIVVKGNQRIEAATIKTYLTIKPGKRYTAADIDDSVKALYATSLFADVGIVQSGSVLVVTVVENPIINSVIFEGNKKIKSDVLSTIVELKPRGVLTDAKLQADVFHIKEYYRMTGRGSAEVEGRITQLPDNRVNIVFAVSEGERTGVAAINFVGNQAFSDQRLGGIVSTKATNWLSWLTQNDVYSEDRLNADADALRSFYLKHGYADFQVLSQDASFDAAKGRYAITITVDEGPKYKFGEVSIDSSIQGVDTNGLTGLLRTRSGQTFDSSKIEKSTEDLTIELSRLGYVFAQVRPRGDRDYSNNTINLTYVIDEGQRVYIERIDIRGNTKSRDYVIRREFDVSEGDAYNRVLINKAERKLRDLDYFKTVSITTEPGSAPDKVVVVVAVEDKSTGSFGIAGGVETSAGSTGLVAEVSMDENNFLGRGQQVHLSVGGGLDEQSIRGSFTDPYFLGNHMSFTVSGYRTFTDSSSARPFKTVATGGGVNFGLPITDELTFEVGYKINNIDSSEYDKGTDCTTNPTACFFPAGSRLSSMGAWGVTYSTIDSKLDPHEGIYLRFAQDIAGLGGNARFIRSTADARLYTPLMDGSDLVGLLKVTGGNITGLGQPVSTIDSFFKGGETIRGFASLGYGPRYYDPAGGYNIALGGKNYVNGTAEVQFPFPALPQDWGLRAAVFADAGLLWGADVPSTCSGTCDATKVMDDTAIRSSVGGSIIWASPFGPIRADFAHAINKKSYDTTQFFRIGTGTSF
jgi:outer membrane protein insertion porin family